MRNLRKRLSGLLAWLAIVTVGLPGPEHALARGPRPTDEFTTTVAYVVQFYPLWFTYYQSRFASTNRLVGPQKVTPLYQIVVAINNDTIYASTFLDLTGQPVILIVPPTSNTYSILTLDPYGNIFETSLQPTPSGGTYALTGPGFAGSLPQGVTQVAVPLSFSELIFRTDKFSSTGEDETSGAEAFRAGLFTRPLCAYLGQTCPTGTPPGGPALVLPEIAFSLPFKTAADALIAEAPITFLRQLQVAVAAPNTPPMTANERALSDAFNRLFGDGNFGPGDTRQSGFSGGAQTAHASIVDQYLTHLDPNNWIHFTNIGHWGDDVLQRASITEYIQYGNSISTAAYYHAFRDEQGVPLDGNGRGYVLTFPASQIPEALRFWSITAYTPESIELVDNPANKYEVASYTPGLQTNADGSLSIFLARTPPPGVPTANWLPIPHGPFNIMLRVYGVVPNSSVANNTYVPPGIERIR